MVPITYGVTGLLFGMTAETGVIVISCDITTDAREKEVLDNIGNIVGIGTYAFKRDYKVSATWLNTGTGIATASIGTTISLANTINTNGVSGGLNVVKRINHRYSQEDFVKYELDTTQYPVL
jgi:hypothetical protein